MKLHHRVTGTLTAAVFALTSLAPAATTPPQIKAPKTPPTVKTPPSPPKVPSVPKVPVVKVPSTPKMPTVPKVPVVPKVQAPPKVPVVKVPVVKVPAVPKVPTVKTPTVPKVPVVKTPVVKAPVVVKTPAVSKIPAVKTPVVVKAPSTPNTPKGVKTPTIIKGTTTTTTTAGTKIPGVVGKTPVSSKTIVPAAAAVTAATAAAAQDQSKKAPETPPAAPASKVVEADAPATQMTIQGGGKNADKGKDNSSAPEVDETSTELLQSLGFDKAQAAKLVAQTQDEDASTRATAKETIRIRADAKATQEQLESLVGEEQAAVVGQKLIDPKTRADTEKNLRLVLDAAANLQVTGVDDEKAQRVIDSLIRNGTTDKKVIDEITGRLIVKQLTGQDVPQGDPDDADAATALDIARNLINAKGDLALLGVDEDDPLLAKTVDEIVKGRVTDRTKAREIVEAAAAESLEKSGLIPPGKPGETLQDRLGRAARQQAEEAAAAKKPKPRPDEAKKPSKPISLADSIAGRFAKVAGAEDSDGPKNDTGTSPSVLELVFGDQQPRTGGPKGVKDGKLRTGITKGGNVKGGGGSGIGKGKGRIGTVGDANGRIVAKAGEVSQPVNTGGPRLAKDPDSSPVKDVTRSPVQNGTPVDNTAPPTTPATPGPAGDPAATGNAQVAGEQDLPNTNPQQPGATDPAGSNMDTNGGTFTVTDTTTTGAGADSTTAISFSVSGSPGGASDGDYVTTYFSDGTYITERVTADGGHELVGGGEGRPPAGVKEGDSTNVVQGDQAVFAGDESTQNGGGEGNGGGGGGGGNDDGDDDNNDDNDDNTADTGTPPATTEDNAAADATEENDDTAAASQEGTPNPEAAERGSRSGRLAEATQGRLGGDEQRRQNKAIDQRKNGNGASTPTGDETSSGVLLTAQEKSAFAKHLGLQRSRGVTTPTGEEAENSSIDIASALEALAVRRGALINPAGGIGDKGGSGQGFGKGGFTPGTAPTGPAPKGKQVASDDDDFGSAPQPGAGGATGAILGAPIGAPPGGVNVNGAAASQALKGAVRVNSSQVQQNVGR